MIRVGALCGVIILMLSCNASERSDYPYDFAYHGALKEMMRKGKISAVADLKDLDSIPHLYALGAIENLKGEIQIFNSQPYHTQVIDNQISFDSSYNKKATLLVYASVKAWKEFSIPREVCTYPVLEEFIEAKAKENR
ncbi:MAG: hypothetical protein KJP00_12275, partial [Bacteroidia bacterium]|nr:hypothetical protein [Bacteroidia bacterium]